MSRAHRWIPVGVLLATGAWTASCPGGANGVAALPCPPATDVSAPGTAAVALVGEWRITAIATSGRAQGDTASGTLSLKAFSTPRAATGDVSYPAHGSATLALDSLGAVAPGSIAAQDPGAPGALVIVQPSAVVIRLGADANRTDRLRFDGAYMALTVTTADSSRFAGQWRSGGVDAGHTASGHFCAERLR